MYDDYPASKDVRARLGTATTRSREDRLARMPLTPERSGGR